jgi:hypothetical protein
VSASRSWKFVPGAPQLSTGPKSPEGKATASLNAVKTALTGRTVLLSSDDATDYERHIRAYQDELKPVGQPESDLVQSIADTAWRLARIPGLEMAIYAKGHMQFAESFNDRDPSLRRAIIELQTHLTYEKQLRNLQLQEARLHRRREKDTAELRRLQEERQQEIKRKQLEALDAAVRQYVLDKEDKKPFNPIEHGFEFSMHEIKDHLGSKSAFWIQSVIAARDHRRALQSIKMGAEAA